MMVVVMVCCWRCVEMMVIKLMLIEAWTSVTIAMIMIKMMKMKKKKKMMMMMMMMMMMVMVMMMMKSLPARRVFTTARRDEVEQALHPATPAASWPQGPPQKTTRRPRSRPRSVPDPGRTGGPLHSAALGSP